MPELTPIGVEYPAADPNAAGIFVERVTLEQVTEDLARGVVRLTRDAYAAQFGGRQVPRSAIMEAYAPTDDNLVAERQRQIAERVEGNEAQYWVIRGNKSDELLGLSKVMDPDPGATYLADVMVAPPWKRGLGSRLLHAPFVFGSFDLDSRVELDGYVGSDVNEWYQKLGFEPRHISGLFTIGSYDMLMRMYVAPSTVALRGVVARLEKATPALADARVHPQQ